jgi:hypothetical protein
MTHQSSEPLMIEPEPLPVSTPALPIFVPTELEAGTRAWAGAVSVAAAPVAAIAEEPDMATASGAVSAMNVTIERLTRLDDSPDKFHITRRIRIILTIDNTGMLRNPQTLTVHNQSFAETLVKRIGQLALTPLATEAFRQRHGLVAAVQRRSALAPRVTGAPHQAA